MNFVWFSLSFKRTTDLLYHIQAFLSRAYFVNSLWTSELSFFLLDALLSFLSYSFAWNTPFHCDFSRSLVSDSLIIISPFPLLVNYFFQLFSSLFPSTVFFLLLYFFIWFLYIFALSFLLITIAQISRRLASFISYWRNHIRIAHFNIFLPKVLKKFINCLVVFIDKSLL